jgi:hypothetical protein
MQYDGKEMLIPQLLEEIMAAEWMGRDRDDLIFSSTYASLHDLLHADMNQRG